MGVHTYRPAEGHGLAHNPFNAIVGPRPIGWIGTLAADGRRNLAPYSFFNAFNYTPPLVGFSSTAWKHTARNCADTGEFTWNLVSRDLLVPMNETATLSDVDEFVRAGLTPEASEVIAAPRVGEARVTFECRVTQQIELTDVAGRPSGAVLTVGEVVMVHIDDDLLVDGIFDTVRAEPLLRGGGPTAYFGIADGSRLDLARPRD
ncbi:flavin reductase family protein [Propioniciclava sp. MC1595]|uniref:flavin reductase family protein n=1 Tax=Propioniciclava sp. MC1595 TaxID=2760308 RepID=UPI0016623FD5|nr:flavin reductase family protein [Propioniciclava sp. MC1595]MBB1495218.1 flavin reductase family protein [Propioniciclava sp. MC1595]QTE26345.1 flavin reductase family protein [Propioniciclava sp. MC1595]